MINPRADSLAYDDIQIGMEFTFEHAFSQDDVLQFAQLSGDYSPLHVDADYAANTEFGRCVVHGILLASLFSRMVGMHIPGKQALYLGQDLTFRRVVLVDEPIRVSAKVTSKTDATRSILLATEIKLPDGKTAVSGTAKVKVRDEINSGRLAEPTAQQKNPGQKISHAKVAVIAGGSGGIGSGIAREFVQQGIAVALLYHANQNRAERTVANLNRAGGRAIAIKADLTDPMQVQTAFTQICESLGEPSIVINAASSPIGQRPVIELERGDFQQHLDVQVHAAMEIARAAYPYMKQSGGGAIVNIASQVVSDVPPPRMADYVTAKYALLGLSKALAIEWAEDNIRVNVVSPGLVQTELTQHYHDRVFKMEASRTPLKRLATPEDVARAVAFLASDSSSFMTGINLSLTGGQVML